MGFKIDKNVPLESRRNKYPFDQMEIGDSFVVQSEDKNRIRAAAHSCARGTDKKYCTRSVGDTVRVWRIK